MGFNINEEITTTLHFKDIALIAAAFHSYKKHYGKNLDEETKIRINRLVDRLGLELYDCPQYEPNGH